METCVYVCVYVCVCGMVGYGDVCVCVCDVNTCVEGCAVWRRACVVCDVNVCGGI